MRKADKNWNYFELSTAERKTAHKYLKKQANGIISKPIHKLTLNRYFEIVREAMLALCENNGLFRNWYKTSTQINYKELSPKEAAKICMDGRSLFHSDYGDKCGLLGNIDHDDPAAFKWWVCNARWRGHPYETKFGNFDPCPIRNINYQNRSCIVENDQSAFYSDYWFLCFSTGHRCTPAAFRGYIHLSELGLPVIWAHHDNDIRYLTKRYTVSPINEPNWVNLDTSFIV
ncbi:MAG: hypothetical protein FWD13_10010 [Treponema sp.]|nr:hypothetical protein [Treponema sp.]